MRGVAILVLGALLCAPLACNSEATVCPNPAACDQPPVDAGAEAGDAPAEAGDADASGD